MYPARFASIYIARYQHLYDEWVLDNPDVLILSVSLADSGILVLYVRKENVKEYLTWRGWE